MTEQRLEPNSKEFYEKYGFTLTMTQKHPFYDGMMEFKGLEANYVAALERDIEHYKRTLADALMNNQHLMTREHHRLQDEIKRLSRDKE